LFSLILRPQVPVEKLSRCTLIWGAAIADELNLHVKWPNDIVDRSGRKIGGILTEVQNMGENWRVIFGFGLNVNQQEFPDSLPNPASLRMLGDGSALDRAAICGRLVTRILSEDVHQSMDLWRKRSNMIGKKVQVGSVVGVAERIREDGALIVDGREILAGDVKLIGEIE
jgi:BirA family biotin operon repressor/biotin-[acetyl-CoA-carboxylase] ligase